MCSLINNFFEIEIHLLDVSHFNKEFSAFGNTVDETKIVLIQNSHAIFSKLEPFEYIVLIGDDDEDLAEMVKTFESNDEILYISKIDNTHLSSKDLGLTSQLLALLQ